MYFILKDQPNLALSKLCNDKLWGSCTKMINCGVVAPKCWIKTQFNLETV